MIPSHFRSLHPDEQAELRAVYDVENSIEHYYNSERQKIFDRDKDK